MNRRVLGAALSTLALLLAQDLALAKSKSFMGQVPPEITGATHVSGEKATELGNFRGRVVVLLFFSSQDASAVKDTGDLERLHATYKDGGLVAIAVSEDPKAKLDDFLKQNKLSYTILSSSKVAKAYGVQGTPALYVLGSSGRVVIEGTATDARALAPHLAKVVRFETPAGNYSKKLEAALRAATWGDFKAASAELARFAKDPGEDGANATKIQKWFEDLASKKLGRADQAKEAGDLIGARDLYAELDRRWPSTLDVTSKARERLAELKKDEAAKKAFGCEKDYGDALAAEEVGDREQAARLFRRCGAACQGTRFADWCEKKAANAEHPSFSPPAGGVTEK